MQVRSLGQEDPLEKEMAPHSSILAWRIPWTERAGYSPQGHKESDTTEQLHFNRKNNGTTNLSNHYKHSLPIYMDSISKSLLWFAKDFDLYDLFSEFEVMLSKVTPRKSLETSERFEFQGI